MNLHLRVLHGTLKKQDGAAVGSDIAVRGQRFIIGSGADCHMRCPSSSISEYHCEFVAEDQGIFLKDLHSDSGTLVNGERVTAKRAIRNGDHVQVGRLEFECVVSAAPPPPGDPRAGGTRPAASPEPAAIHTETRSDDSIGDDISDMLSAEDARDREHNRHDPTALQFKPEEAPPLEDVPAEEKMKKRARPPKQPPGKLPPKPNIVADNTVNAAEEVLKKFFEKPKK